MSAAIGRRGRLAGRSELGVALLLGVVGVVVLVDALRPRRAVLAESDPVGPAAVPFVVGRRCCWSARCCSRSTCCAAAAARPRRARTSTSTAPTEWRVVLPLLGGLRRQRRC